MAGNKQKHEGVTEAEREALKKALENFRELLESLLQTTGFANSEFYGECASFANLILNVDFDDKEPILKKMQRIDNEAVNFNMALKNQIERKPDDAVTSMVFGEFNHRLSKIVANVETLKHKEKLHNPKGPLGKLINIFKHMDHFIRGKKHRQHLIAHKKHKEVMRAEGKLAIKRDAEIAAKHAEEAEKALVKTLENSVKMDNSSNRPAKIVQLFNLKPNKAIEAWQANNNHKPSNKDIANFLKDGVESLGVDKTKVGEYLGERSVADTGVLKAYVEKFDFEKKNFVDALREFLEPFRLPGEAQKIDRIMEAFAKKYCENNPGVFANSDAAYTLAFSVIMLNTDAHNPAIKAEKKMTEEGFIKNNRGMNGGVNFDRDMLQAIYKEITTHEIKMKDEKSISAKLSR